MTESLRPAASSPCGEGRGCSALLSARAQRMDREGIRTDREMCGDGRRIVIRGRRDLHTGHLLGGDSIRAGIDAAPGQIETARPARREVDPMRGRVRAEE